MSQQKGTRRSGHGDTAPIATFVRLDRRAAALSVVFVVVANALFVRVPGVWLVLVPLAVLVGALLIAERSLGSDVSKALGWIAAGWARVNGW